MLLSNVQLEELLSSSPKIVTAIGPAKSAAAAGAIQPASIDLSVGQIFLPPLKHDGTEKPDEIEFFHDLKSGGSALIVTKQKLDLPSDIAGLMFPKNGDFAQRGILITNFGHVDPGFFGPLKFTVFNFGHDPFRIEVGEKIACLLLIRLDEPANPDWKELRRHDTSNYEAHLRVLNRDFLDLDRRVPSLIESQVERALNRRDRLTGVVIPIVSLVAALVLALAGFWIATTTLIDTKVDGLQNVFLEKVVSISREIVQLENKIPKQEKLKDAEVKEIK